MGKLMEMFTKEQEKQKGQLDLGIERTREELIESIRNKRRKGLHLDEKESELVAKQMIEDRENDNPHYGN